MGGKKPTTTTTIENNNIMTVALIPHIAFRTYLSRPRPILDSEGRSGFILQYIYVRIRVRLQSLCAPLTYCTSTSGAPHVTQNRLSHTVGRSATRNQPISAECRVRAPIRVLIRHSGPFGSSLLPPTTHHPSTAND